MPKPTSKLQALTCGFSLNNFQEFKILNKMKKYINRFLLASVVFSSAYLTSCYKEPDLISEIAVSKGKVAQISIVWLGNTRNLNTSLAVLPNLTTDAGSDSKINIEYSSEVPVKEFRVYFAATSTAAQTLVSTTPAGAQKYDPNTRNYLITLPIKAQDAKRTSRVFFAEIVTENGLVSAQRFATLTTNP